MNTKKDLTNLTQIEKERELKKLRGETEELVDHLGQSSEKKGAQAARDYMKEQEKEREEQQMMEEEMLKKNSNNKMLYQRTLLQIFYRFAKEESIPAKYKLTADSNDNGIAISIDRTNYYGAFKVSGIPFYDIHACKLLAVQLGNTIVKMEGNVHRSEGGIIIPDSQDIKTITKKHGRQSS